MTHTPHTCGCTQRRRFAAGILSWRAALEIPKV
jgi:hypothetical protein